MLNRCLASADFCDLGYQLNPPLQWTLRCEAARAPELAR